MRCFRPPADGASASTFLPDKTFGAGGLSIRLDTRQTDRFLLSHPSHLGGAVIFFFIRAGLVAGGRNGLIPLYPYDVMPVNVVLRRAIADPSFNRH